MKKDYLFKQLITLTLFTLSISGCKKIYDYVETHPDAELRSCGITRFISDQLYGDYTDTLSFTYNFAGDPVKATRPEPRTGAPNFLFKYKNARLSEFIGVYSNGITTENWHRYFYDGSGRIILDSVYIFADIVNGQPANPYDSYAITFIYDSKGRILQEKHNYSEGSTYMQDYQYNTDGNKAGAVYGNNVSFRRSNKIWMFLDRDYSVNDRAGSGDFNAFHMPGSIELAGGSADMFLGNYFSKASINYACDSRY